MYVYLLDFPVSPNMYTNKKNTRQRSDYSRGIMREKLETYKTSQCVRITNLSQTNGIGVSYIIYTSVKSISTG